MLLIDGGQSGCRARYVEARGRGDRVRGASRATTSDARAGDTSRPTSRTARRPSLRTRRPRRPGLPRRGRDYGVATGADRPRRRPRRRRPHGFDGDAAAVAGALGVPVIVSNDAVTAHLGALGGEPGVVIVAGTGVIALAVGPDGRWARADGYGALLGDDGGGHWIGRRGLAAALRARDGRPGGSPALLRRAEARFGERIVPAVYDAPDPVATIAALRPRRGRRRAAGDEVAAAIWEDAARQLAETARAAARTAGLATSRTARRLGCGRRPPGAAAAASRAADTAASRPPARPPPRLAPPNRHVSPGRHVSPAGAAAARSRPPARPPPRLAAGAAAATSRRRRRRRDLVLGRALRRRRPPARAAARRARRSPLRRSARRWTVPRGCSSVRHCSRT